MMKPQTRPAPETEAEPDGHDSCRAVGQVLDRIGDKWTVMVVGMLSPGPLRFNALLRAIGGVSHRMLTLTLRSLERDALVKRTVYPAVPPKVEYELTDLGRSLIEPLRVLADWAQVNRPALEAGRLRFDEAKEGDVTAPEQPSRDQVPAAPISSASSRA